MKGRIREFIGDVIGVLCIFGILILLLFYAVPFS